MVDIDDDAVMGSRGVVADGVAADSGGTAGTVRRAPDQEHRIATRRGGGCRFFCFLLPPPLLLLIVFRAMLI